jgi:hypothetical protein
VPSIREEENADAIGRDRAAPPRLQNSRTIARVLRMRESPTRTRASGTRAENPSPPCPIAAREAIASRVSCAASTRCRATNHVHAVDCFAADGIRPGMLLNPSIVLAKLASATQGKACRPDLQVRQAL